jgi:molybdopterin molybdotransferase
MTGAVMPAGCDTVVPQELCSADGTGHASGPACCARARTAAAAAKTWRVGSAALRAGRVLRPADLGLLASLGFESVAVVRRLRVALFSTGDEIRTPGQPLDAGCIYDSNRYSLIGALQRLGVEVLDLGLVRDDPAALRATLQRAVAEADAVLTSGGVSVGDADYTRDLLAELGEVAFWKVAMRPGRPFAFGRCAGRKGGKTAWLFALPGNPVAALVTFYAFAREACWCWPARSPPLATLRCAAPRPSASARAAPSSSAASSSVRRRACGRCA